ncbi:MAG: CheR family methyltransferase [Desulfosalsimonadaceae bacterium]
MRVCWDLIFFHLTFKVYEIEKIKTATKNYQQSGGKVSFSEYYHARYNAAVMDVSLKERITFANHNLAVDNVFGEVHLVFCRNVLIYFNRDLQNRVLELFTESLVHGGFLCLGAKEDLRFTDVRDWYEIVNEKERIYRKKGV